MDPEEISRLPERVLDGKVAEAFFSSRVVWTDGDEPVRVDKDLETGMDMRVEVSPYSVSIDHAWRIVDLARAKGWTVSIHLRPEDVEVVMTSGEDAEMGRATAAYTPRALAEAALQAGLRGMR
ncbi:hypothetical protein [Desulfohalovibrio reitneri]|uniref:hypothetical protein n=1 Tax=Desulfohalovibrio reitneri TaxID=1307759 RepID=UPI0004A761E4|nr:hypothetical protein [Desulfohalovibrio reitneri]